VRVVGFFVQWALLALAVVLAAWVTPDVDLRGGPLSALVVAVLVAVANVGAHVILRWLPASDNVLVLGALALVVNGCVVWLASAFTSRLHVSGLLAAITFALMVTVFSVGLGWTVERLLARRRRSSRADAA
jgi:uncharacterized membrane protein YvlD (DUF360 family)